MAQIRKLFTNEEILTALSANSNKSQAARELSELRSVTVTPQLLSYWEKALSYKKKNGDSYVTNTKANKAIRAKMELRSVGQDDYDRVAKVAEDNSRILFIPDQHAPYHHKDTIAFLSDVASAMEPTRVINLGDEVDNHGLSMHDSDPNLDSPGMELSKAKLFLKDLAELFPVMDICHSNHGSLVYRRAMKFGIPVEYIKSYRDILFEDNLGDGWEWKQNILIELPNGERLVARHQSSGDTLLNAAHERANVIEGHEHGTFEIRMKQNEWGDTYWQVTSGCLIDELSLAFAYGKNFTKKPVIGLTVVLDSQPYLIKMPQDAHGRYTGKLDGMFG